MISMKKGSYGMKATMTAYRMENFGTWGMVQLRQPIPAHTPRKPTPPDFEPPTLTVLPKAKPVYAVGVQLRVQNPATARKEVVTAEVINRFHLTERTASEGSTNRRVNTGLTWLYLVRVNGVSGESADWLLNESAVTSACKSAKIVRDPVASDRLAS
jgi:hypothetical protein